MAQSGKSLEGQAENSALCSGMSCRPPHIHPGPESHTPKIKCLSAPHTWGIAGTGGGDGRDGPAWPHSQKRLADRGAPHTRTGAANLPQEIDGHWAAPAQRSLHGHREARLLGNKVPLKHPSSPTPLPSRAPQVINSRGKRRPALGAAVTTQLHLLLQVKAPWEWGAKGRHQPRASLSTPHISCSLGQPSDRDGDYFGHCPAFQRKMLLLCSFLLWLPHLRVEPLGF